MIRLALLALTLAIGVHASCYPLDACRSFNPKTTAAFLGRIVKSEPIPDGAVVWFSVVEVLYGLPKATKDIVAEIHRWTPSDSSGGGGLVYIIGYRKADNHVVASSCGSRIGRPEYNQADIDFLRNVRDGRARPTLWVDVRVGGKPIVGAAVELNGPVRRSGATGPDGWIAVRGLPLGTYTLKASHPEYDSPPASVIHFRQPNCVSELIQLISPITVTGRIVDSTGSPLPHVAANLMPPERYANRDSGRLVARSDGEGRFTLTGVPPGSYQVGFSLEQADHRSNDIIVPPCRLPQLLQVKPRTPVRDLLIRCESAGRLREVRIKVVSGWFRRPVAGIAVDSPFGVYVNSDPRRALLRPGLKTDANGIVRLRILSGAYVYVQARRTGPDGQEDLSGVASAGLKGPAEITLTLP